MSMFAKYYDDLERLMCILDELNRVKYIYVEDIKVLIQQKIDEHNPLR